MKKFVLIVLAAVFVIVGGAMLKKDNKNNANIKPTNHTFGSGSTGVVLKEYADFQCPGCAAFYPVIKQVTEKYKEQITFQFINFPLSSIHQNTLAAHRAAQAASNQDKFWEMHDLLYENQRTWQDSTNIARDLEVYANQLGLDMPKYKTDYASAETNSIIQADIKTGQDLKVTGTPTLFLDGKLIEDTNSISTFEKLSEAIDKAIAEKTGTAPPTSTETTPPPTEDTTVPAKPEDQPPTAPEAQQPEPIAQ